VAVRTGVYIIQNIITGAVYVGSTSHDFRIRFKTHRKQLRDGRHDNPYLQNAWNKYGEDNFDFLIVEPLDDSLEVILTAEQRWINAYRNNPDVDCYNIRLEANSSRGIKRSPHWINKLVERNQERFDGFIGPDECEYRDIVNLKDFCRKHGLNYGNMHQVANGKRRHHKGWRHIDNPQKMIQRRGQRRRFIAPNGEVYLTTDFTLFCREHGLEHSAMVAVAKGERKHHKGWRVENLDL
jgi:group I intron endonuclease